MKKISALVFFGALLLCEAASAHNVKQQNYLYYFGGPAPTPYATPYTAPCPPAPCAPAQPECPPPPPPPCECPCCPH